jgi:hypothetical protein
MALESHTIVKKVRGGPDKGRFVILSEQPGTKLFVFKETGPEMTIDQVCIALLARGISEVDAMRLVAEAEDDFRGRQSA